MSKRKSYFANFSTDSLFMLLEQRTQELLELELKRTSKDTKELHDRIEQINLVISSIKSIIIERYLTEGISVTKAANLLISSQGYKAMVYKELFTLKVLETNEPISLERLESAIDKLDIEELMTIIRLKENTVYETYAMKRYDKIIFDVEDDVLEEFQKKMKLDRRKEN